MRPAPFGQFGGASLAYFGGAPGGGGEGGTAGGGGGPPLVQRKPVRILLSNWHSTARSRAIGTSFGTSLRVASTRAVIVRMPVFSDESLPMSMSANGIAAFMTLAQRSARPR